LVVVPRTMGVILDPSSSEDGLGARMGLDATKPLQEKAIRLKIPKEAEAFAKRLLSSINKGKAGSKVI